MVAFSGTIGRRGSFTLPKKIRDAFGLQEGSLVIVEQREDGILIRPAVAIPREVENYTPERRIEFLLNNAVTSEDYDWARAEATRLGIDPDSIDHVPPPKE